MYLVKQIQNEFLVSGEINLQQKKLSCILQK